MKRVITGERYGTSYLAHVGEVEPVVSHGFEMRLMWGQDALPLQLPTTAESPSHDGQFFPPSDGVRMTLIHFLPDGQGSGGDALGAIVESDGFHRTDSQDVGWLISGELGIELEDGSVTWLEPGDLIVQNGTRHRWRNRNSDPAVAGFVTLGAVRALGD
ncbi:MAG: cupin [Marmoricola sp.]|nr:cupin [Marmoricola sp.]